MSYDIFVPTTDVGMLRIDLMLSFVGYFNFMCFSLAKKDDLYPKKCPIFCARLLQNYVLGVSRGAQPFAVNGDGTRFRQ